MPALSLSGLSPCMAALFQLNAKGALPPVVAAISVVVPPAQLMGDARLSSMLSGSAFWEMVVLAVAEQPLVSVTVTLWSPSPNFRAVAVFSPLSQAKV